MARKRKMSQAATIRVLKDAVEDVRQNGRAGRTVPEIAAQHRCNTGSLRTKLYEAGLTNLGNRLPSEIQAATESASMPTRNPDKIEEPAQNPLIANEESSFPTNLVGNRENGGMLAAPERPLSDDPEIAGLKREIINECRAKLRMAKAVEIKSASEYRAIALLALDLLGDQRDSGATKQPIFQVTILGDNGRRDPKMVQVIEVETVSSTDSSNENGGQNAGTLEP